MPNLLNSDGLQTATRAELLATYTTAMQAIYGTDINLESDTPDGQLINIIIQSVLDVEDLINNVYNAFDPDNAIGNVLDQRAAINGIQRQEGTYTITNISVVTSSSVNLFGLDQATNQIFTVADNAGNEWELISTVTGTGIGTHAYAFRAANPGQVLTIPNTITNVITVILGVTAVNNPTVYTQLGTNEEPDIALKVRRQKSVSIPSQGFSQGLTAALENINGISSAVVHENDGGSTDVNGIPGHSIWVVTSGTPAPALGLAYNSATTYSYGQIVSSGGVNYISIQNNNLNNIVTNTAFWSVYNSIAQTIYTYRNAGCGMYGSLTYNVGQLDGSFFPVYWDTVAQILPFIKMKTSSLNGVNPPNLTAIQSLLVTQFQPTVAAEININQVTSISQIADPNTLGTFPSTFGLSTSSTGPYTYTLTPAALNDQFSIAANNVILLPMVVTCPGVQFNFDGNNFLTGVQLQTRTGQQTLFSVSGGYAPYTWVVSGGGSCSPGSGTSTTYTAAGFGLDTLTVTDSLSNTMVAQITVSP